MNLEVEVSPVKESALLPLGAFELETPTPRPATVAGKLATDSASSTATTGCGPSSTS